VVERLSLLRANTGDRDRHGRANESQALYADLLGCYVQDNVKAWAWPDNPADQAVRILNNLGAGAGLTCEFSPGMIQ